MNELTTAHRLLNLVDLTSLNDGDMEIDIARLCEQAVTDFGKVAAVCVWPQFVPLCRKWLADTGIRVATVANFPEGRDDLDCALAETAAALAYGADEVDVVFPYNAWLAGEQVLAWDIMAACRDVCHDTTLKIILETGRLRTPQNIAAASQGAIEIGADFIKTSTGKVEVSATRPAATVMLSAIKQSGEPVGFKAAGGIRTTAEATEYLDLAEGIMGSGWATPDTFRIGASALLEDLLTALDRNEQL
jgi:deoxyribose-phosphate aldolase